jgi:hypothetical protein
VPEALRLGLSRTGFEILAIRSSGDPSSLLSTLQYHFAGRLLWHGAPAFWAASALGLLLSPLTALLDRVQGGGPALHALARRPALS